MVLPDRYTWLTWQPSSVDDLLSVQPVNPYALDNQNTAGR
jgi:hypothetical protein